MPYSPSLYINNSWQSGHGPLFRSTNPATGETVWEGNAAGPRDIQKALEVAKSAFDVWSRLSLENRFSYLHSFGEALQRNREKLAEAICRETGKPKWEALTEVEAMVKKIDISLSAYGSRCPEIIKEVPLGQLITRHKPHGVSAVFGPFNFPGHLPNGHIIPALLAGNTVIFKPSEYTPLVAEVTTRCWEESGLPSGVFNLLQGARTTGQALAEHPLLDALFFTGSSATGKHLAEFFADHPEKILALEMGGNNPLVIGTVNSVHTAAYLTIQSAYITSGQRCTCARRLIVPESEAGYLFLNKLQKLIKGIKVGPYTVVPEPFMGPVISAATAMRLLDKQKALIKQGAQPLVEMQLLQEGTGLLTPGLIDMTAIPQRADEEIFGPLLQVIRVPSFDAALEEANRTAYGLCAGLISEDPEEYSRFLQKIRAGVINRNTPLTGASSLAPFGGIGLSGNHRPSAFYAADYCSYPVASMENPHLQMPTTLTPGIDCGQTENL